MARKLRKQLYEGIDCARLIRLFYEQDLSVDMLAYTPELDTIVDTYNHYTDRPIDHQTCCRTLIRLRKDKKLIPKKDKGRFTRLGQSAPLESAPEYQEFYWY